MEESNVSGSWNRRQAASPGAAGVTVTWTAGPEADIAGFDVLRSVGGGAYEKLNTAPLAALTYLDRSLPKGQTATYAVRALDSSGNRSAASPASVPVVPSAA